MKNKFCVLFIIALVVLWIGGCENTEQSHLGSSETSSIATQPDTSPMSVFQSVLQNKTPFFSTDAKKDLYVNQLDQAVSVDSSVEAKVTKYAIVDLENDGIPEVILWLVVNNNDDFGFGVLRYQDGAVYGYILPYRAFMDLKDDGTFSFSSGAADYGFGTAEFTKEGYTVKKIAYSESDYDSDNNQVISYFVNNESASKEDFLSAIDKQNGKAELCGMISLMKT